MKKLFELTHQHVKLLSKAVLAMQNDNGTDWNVALSAAASRIRGMKV